MSVLPVLLLLVGGPISTLAATPSPISVDDTSPLVNYSNINDWTTHVNVQSNWSLYQNTDTFSSVQGAWFLFEFNGTEIEYWGNQGPYHGPCRVTLEDGTSQIVSSHLDVNDDPILLFSIKGLAEDVVHSIKVTVVNSSYPNVCELDRFVYTPLPGSAAASSQSNTPQTSKPSIKFIAMGAAIGAAVLVIAVVVWYFIWKRRKRNRSRENIDIIDIGGTPMLGGFPESHSHGPYSPRDLSPASGWTQNRLSRGQQRLSSALSATSTSASGSQTPYPPSSSPSGFVPPTDEKAGFSQPSMLPTPFPYSPTRDPYLSPMNYAPANTPLATSSQTSFNPQVTATALSSRAIPALPYASSSRAPQFQPVPASSSLPASPQTATKTTEPVTFSSLGPYQHQDAGRVIPPEELVPHPDEIPPAYMDWNSRG